MVRYEVAIHDRQAHLLRVTLTLAAPAAEQRLSLPVWIPGSYLVREFARHLSKLEATQGARQVALEQLDKTTWLARCQGRTALRVSWLVYAFDNSVRTAWLDAERGFFNGTSVFLQAEGRAHEPHEVRLTGLPRGWLVATGMAAAGPNRWRAADYDELIDHPFELGRFWRGEFKARGVAHEFVVAGAWPGFDGARLLADTRRICETEIDFWHGKPPRAGKAPFERYVFMLNAVDDGYGGLEHRASTALIAGRRDLPRGSGAATARPASDGYITLLGLVSHEYFHTWNVKRLKPRDFAPYDMTRENYTELLWFFEGFTSYYDDLFLARAGLVDAPRYLRLLAKPVNQVLATPGRRVQSVAQASFDAWTKFYRPDENTANATLNYYTAGSLVALALDLRLRSAARGSLDEVMRALWQSSGGGPIDEAAILAAVEAQGGRALARELSGWVHGRDDDLPLQPLLAEFGVSWSHEAAGFGQRLGARVNDALKVQAVMRASCAERSGLAVGDELIACDGWRLKKLDDAAQLGALERPVPLLVSRDGRLVNLTLAPATARGAVTLAIDAKAPAAARRRREAWLAP